MRNRPMIAAAVGGLALWGVVVLWIVPALIASAYAGESLPFLNRLLEGRATTPLSEYHAAWRKLALYATLGLGAAAGAGAALWTQRHAVPEQLRAAAAALPATGTAGAVLFGVWFGLLVGLAEAINGLVRHRIQHLPTGEVVSGELIWLVPVTAAVSFAGLALVLAALDRLLRARGLILGAAPALIVGLGVFSFLRALSVGFASYAVAVLAIGLGVVMTRLLIERGAGFRRVVRYGTPALVLALAAWAAAVPIWRAARAARAVAALPDPPAGAPNVILLIWDTVRAANLSAYGYERETTPTLARLAAGGVLFEAAYATSPWSLPSHAGMFTGRYPHELTVTFNTPLDATHPTLGEVLSRHGYATAGFTANLFYGSASYGIARGLTYYDDRVPLRPVTFLHSWWLTRDIAQRLRLRLGNYQNMLRRDARHVNRALVSWIRRQDERPFLAIVNHFDAHLPYIPPAPFDRAFSDAPARAWATSTEQQITPQMQRTLITAYDACIRYLDHELGRLIEELRALGKLDNTILIVTSDHGEQFAEERPHLTGHSISLFPTVLQVPLVLYYPAALPQNVRRGETVSIRDIPATVMDLVGLVEGSPFPGTSLARYATGSVTPEEAGEPRLAATQRHRWARAFPHWPAARGDQFAIVDGPHEYILDGTGREHLYHIASDIFVQKNLAEDPASAGRVEHYRMLLDSLVPARDGARHAAAPLR